MSELSPSAPTEASPRYVERRAWYDPAADAFPASRALQPKRLNVFERYLSLWVALCMVAGVLLGKAAPALMDGLSHLEFGEGSQINVPIAVLIWLMITPMMMKVDFGAVRNVGRRPKGLLVTLFVNWLVKPFSMAAFAWLFFRLVFSPWIVPADADQCIAGTIILAAAPCTAMVFVWSYLSDGDPAYTLVQVSVARNLSEESPCRLGPPVGPPSSRGPDPSGEDLAVCDTRGLTPVASRRHNPVVVLAHGARKAPAAALSLVAAALLLLPPLHLHSTGTDSDHHASVVHRHFASHQPTPQDAVVLDHPESDPRWLDDVFINPTPRSYGQPWVGVVSQRPSIERDETPRRAIASATSPPVHGPPLRPPGSRAPPATRCL